MNVTYWLVCKLDEQIITNPELAVEYLVQKGYRKEYILSKNINSFYTVVPVLTGWPVPNPKKKTKGRKKR